jgi:predicted ribosome quality control (RQC) complex YloA/Tae2 family protein
MSSIFQHYLSEELSAIEQEVDRYERARMKIDDKIEGFLEALAQRKDPNLISAHSSLVSPR